MLVLTQNKKSLREVDVINVDKENPNLESDEQPYVLVGFNTHLENEGAVIIGTFSNEDEAMFALNKMYADFEHGLVVASVPNYD